MKGENTDMQADINAVSIAPIFSHYEELYSCP